MSHHVKVTVSYEYDVLEESLQQAYGIDPGCSGHAIVSRIFAVDGHTESIVDMLTMDTALNVTMNVDGIERTIDA